MDAVQKSLQKIELEDAVAHGSLAMWPLVGATDGGPAYLLLGDATRDGKAHVTEVSESGQVAELKLTNSADLPVLILEGEQLVGAKQNRTTNLTILAPPRATIIIPVSCVEAGRWRATSREAEVSDTVHMACGRAAKAASVSFSMHHEGAPRADQQRVWDDIGEAAIHLGASSPTRAMADIFDAHRPRIEEFVAAIRPVEHQLGALFAIAGEPVGFDLFDHHSTLCEMLPKLVRSYAVETLRAGEGSREPLTDSRVRELVEAAASARVETFPAVGLGTTVRISANGLVGGGLVHDDRLVHLAAFVIADEPGAHGSDGFGVASVSHRRRSYRR